MPTKAKKKSAKKAAKKKDDGLREGWKVVRIRNRSTMNLTGGGKVLTSLFRKSHTYKVGGTVVLDDPGYGFDNLEDAIAWQVKAEAVALKLRIEPFVTAIYKIRFKPDADDESIFRPFAVNHAKCRKSVERPKEVQETLWAAWVEDDGETIGHLLSEGLISRAPKGTVLFTQFKLVNKVPKG